MASDAENVTTRRSSPWALRFSLKWLFLVVAIFCVWLGFYAPRDRRAREMVALNDAIVNAIEKNVATGPANALLDDSASSRNHELAAFLTQTRPNPNTRREQIKSFFGGGGIYGTHSLNVELNVAPALAAQPHEDIAALLRSHYEQGLAPIGLKRASNIRDMSSSSANWRSSAAVWEMPEKGVTVVIDVSVDYMTNHAVVRIILIQNENLSLW